MERLHLKRAESSSALPSPSSGGVGDTYSVEALRDDDETPQKYSLGAFHAGRAMLCERHCRAFGARNQYKTI